MRGLIYASHAGARNLFLMILVAMVTTSKVTSDTSAAPPICRTGEPPSKRYYNFVVEYFSTMGPTCVGCPGNRTACDDNECVVADGVQRAIVTVNRQMPGPIIQVCKGDSVIVDVVNRMPGTETAVHWHGILQHGTPYMDGTPFVSQCPILEGSTFRYNFVADKVGTYFWHAHDGMQKMDGFTGALIVRSGNDSSLRLHDTDDHLLFLQDWTHELTAGKMPGPIALSRRGQQANNLLINGRGIYISPDGTRTGTPLAELKVKHNVRHRIRIINSGCFECPLQVFIESHNMSVIAVDGSPIQNVTVDSIIVLPGERVDVVLKARKQVRAYWIIVRALADCEDAAIYQRALLVYEGAASNVPSTPDPGYNAYPTRMVLNPMEAKCGAGQGGVCAYQLKAWKRNSPALRRPTQEPLHVEFNFHTYELSDVFGHELGAPIVHKPFYVPGDGDENSFELQAGQINNISMVMPSSPILSQPHDIPILLEAGSLPKCRPNTSEHQNCFNYESVPYHSVFDILFVHNSDDEQGEAHPMHLHGYRFYVLYQGYNLTQLLSDQESNPNPVLKDVVNVPGSGYARVRVYADNPGPWMLHCHIIHHQLSGMSMILNVGTPEQWPPVPPGFPTCGSYTPSY